MLTPIGKKDFSRYNPVSRKLTIPIIEEGVTATSPFKTKVNDDRNTVKE